jgi:hypothetical protein
MDKALPKQKAGPISQPTQRIEHLFLKKNQTGVLWVPFIV